MLASLVMADDASSWALPPRAHRGGAIAVSVLSARCAFPLEFHGLALEELQESATRDLDDFTRARCRDRVAVPEVGEVDEAAARRFGGINDSPALAATPKAHCACGMHD